MIKIENTEVVGWEAAIRGMRNPKKSWQLSDSKYNIECDWISCSECPAKGRENCIDEFNLSRVSIGPNDHKLMMTLAKGGPVHAKYRRMITVYADITAPNYWWSEYDTYKVGTVANSTSTMHKIHAKEFTLEDFSCENLFAADDIGGTYYSKTAEELFTASDVLEVVIEALNNYRDLYLKTKDKKYWWQMIQLLPNSYHYQRTVMVNYEVLAGIYPMRKNHKLNEWREFCKWIETLPYSELITGEGREE